ncbi:hypothetical protein BGV40_17410 [Methanosarcina sp. Ant1]|nr:hypothetical protein BGV40_17410 [Methanosarcina sp. Ant1]
MKMKFITSLLVLCLALSLVPVQAQTDANGMDKAMKADKMSESMDKMTVIMIGKTNGTITYNLDGMAGKTGKTNRTITRKMTGDMIVVKDISNKTENIIIIGKMDGMTKKVVIHGKMDNMGMAGKMDNMGMAGKMDNMDMAGKMDNRGMAEKMDKKTVVVTGDIKCDMAGKMAIIGKMSDMKEVVGENEDMAGMAGYKAGAVGYKSEDMAGVAGAKAGAILSKDKNMTGKMDDKENMVGEMDKNVIATATMRCNMTGKMVIIGRMSDIKAMTGYEKEDMTGIAGAKAGAVGYQDEDKTGIAGAKAGAVGYQDENMAGVAGYKAGAAGYKDEDITLIMTGVVKCKITGINMVVIGEMGEMAGYKAGMDGAGMAGYKAGAVGYKDENMTGTQT